VSFLADIAGIAVLAGIGYAIYRRYRARPDYLAATRQQYDLLMFALVVALIVVGYLLEGLRIEGTRNAYLAGEDVLFSINEQFWSPVGWWVAGLLQSTGLSQEGLIAMWKAGWMFHMVNTMVFVALVPYTRLAHVVLFPVEALLSRKRQGAVLEPMDFEDEEAETFGLGKVSELTARNRLDLISCVECGRCTLVCPATLADKPLDPKRIITKARDLAIETAGDADFWGEDPIFTPDELDSCTTCGACMEECPADIEHVDIIMGARRYKVLTLGEIPVAAADAVGKVQANGNPWGMPQDERFDWAKGMDVPLAEAGSKVDYLYYVGCAGAYDITNQKVVRDTIALLRQAGVDFAVIGKSEKCNGDPVRRFGEEYAFNEIAIENIASLNRYEFDKIVVHCPHCLHTIGKEYAKFADGKFEVVHHTELLADLLKSGKLKPEKRVEQEITFHDPCYLGRHHGEYDAPREILESVPGLKLKEMAHSKDKSLCCGLGGGNMWYELSAGQHLAYKRLDDIRDVAVPVVGTACSFCMINFVSSKAHYKETEDVEVQDVASILAQSLLDKE
jgi:Fe-S oxidoreductase